MSNAATLPAFTAPPANNGVTPISGPGVRSFSVAAAREPWPEGSAISASTSSFSGCVLSGAWSMVSA